MKRKTFTWTRIPNPLLEEPFVSASKPKAVPIQPRGDRVLVRVVDYGRNPSGIAMPDVSQEGKAYIVEAIGPKVEGLKVGDRVLVMGMKGVTYDFIPNSRDLFITAEVNIPLIYGKES